MSSYLRPLSLKEIVDGSIFLVKRHFKKVIMPLFLAGLVVYIALKPIIFFYFGSLQSMMTNNAFPGFGAFGRFLGLICLLSTFALIGGIFYLWVTCACIIRSAGLVREEEIPFGTAMGMGGRRLLWVIIAGIIIGFSTLFGLLFCIIPGLILFVMFYLTNIFILLENKDAIEGIKSSWGFAKYKDPTLGFSGSNFLRITIASFVIFIIGAAVNFIVQLPIFIIAFIVGISNAMPGSSAESMFHTQWLIQIISIPFEIVQTFVRAVIMAISIFASLLIYYSTKAAKEGIDIEGPKGESAPQ